MSPKEHSQVIWAEIEKLRVGDSADTMLRIDEATIRDTARLTGDDNPIHVDTAAARLFGQSRPVAHGVILLGALSRLIGTQLPGPGSVWFQNEVEFLAPMFAGDDITVSATVAHVSAATRVVVLDVAATAASGRAIARGRAKVRVPAPIVRQAPTMDDQRVVIVTGGSRGIGRAITEALAADGMRVAIGYRHDHAIANACVGAVQDRAGRQAIGVAADVSTAEGSRALVEATLEAFGRIDAVVHAATPPVVYEGSLDTPAETFRGYFETYVIGLLELVRLTVPAMKERRHGRIVAILSSAIAEVPPKLSAYVTGKYALLGLCRSLAVELGPFNITVNTVSPSMVVGERTDILGAAARELMARKTPMRRLAEPNDVAQAVRFLVSDEAPFVSGANVPVTGGILF